MSKPLAIASFASGLLLLASVSHAQPVEFYIGGAVGDSDVDVSGYDDTSSWQFFGGMELSPYFAIEAAYTDLGEFDVKRVDNSYVEVDGLELTAVGNLPLSQRVSLFGEAGLFSWDLDAVRLGTRFSSRDGTDLTYGAGVKLGVVDSLKVRLEYQRYLDISNRDIDTLYAGISYGF